MRFCDANFSYIAGYAYRLTHFTRLYLLNKPLFLKLCSTHGSSEPRPEGEYMNCKNCQFPLSPDSQARFCPNCGTVIDQVAPAPSAGPSGQAPWTRPPSADDDYATQLYTPQDTPSWAAQDEATVRGSASPAPSWPAQQPATTRPASPPPAWAAQDLAATRGVAPNQPPGQAIPPTPQQAGQFYAGSSIPAPAPKQRRRGGCVIGCVSTVLILAILATAGWFFVARPALHNFAQQRLDIAMNNAVNQIPPQIALLPVTQPVNVPENALNNMIALNLAPSDPIQQPVTRITNTGVRITFKIYGFDCAISGVPEARNGELVATNVTVEGIISLIMTPQELTAVFNQHLQEAHARLHHNVQTVTLKDHSLDLKLS